MTLAVSISIAELLQPLVVSRLGGDVDHGSTVWWPQ